MSKPKLQLVKAPDNPCQKWTPEQKAHIANIVAMRMVLGGAVGEELSINLSGLYGVICQVFGVPHPKEAEELARGLLGIRAVQHSPKAGPNDQAILNKLEQIYNKLQTTQLPEVEWLTVEEFAKAVNRAKWTVTHDYCQKGLLKCRKLDPNNPKSPWRIHRSEIERFKIEGLNKPVEPS